MEQRPPSTSPRRPVPPGAAPELRERLLEAMAQLLQERRFSQISVADVLAVSGASRASFYFYFPGRAAVLAELVRRAVAEGHDAAEPWLGGPRDAVAALRAGIVGGAQLWQRHAGVLRAIVENWGSDDELREEWLARMESFTTATAARIRDDEEALAHLGAADVDAVAASLTWLGERLYYLAAVGVPPFDDQDVLVETLLRHWTSTLYGRAG